MIFQVKFQIGMNGRKVSGDSYPWCNVTDNADNKQYYDPNDSYDVVNHTNYVVYHSDDQAT